MLHLRGLSTGDFAPALEGFFGSDAGLSASTVTRLTESWRAEHDRWSRRDLSVVDYVYVWADGVYVNVRLPDADGHREDTESWADLLRGLRDRGMTAPELAVGDGALGFGPRCARCCPAPGSSAAGCTRPPTSWPPCPSGPTARPRPRCRRSTPPTPAAVDAVGRFAGRFSAYPKATGKITRDLDVLLTFYDSPAEHWKHLRCSNAIESTFATLRLRQRVTKGPGCREAGVAMAFKLLEAAQGRWRRVNGHELVALVRAGATFIDGQLQERSQDTDEELTVEECAA